MKESEESLTNLKRKKNYGILKIIIAIVATAIITYFMTITITLRSYLNGSGMTFLSTKLGLVRHKLEDTFIYDINEDEMLESAVKGYVNGLDDKYTEYLTKKEMADLLENTSGNYVGLGVYLAADTQNNTVVIVGVIEDSAAEKAGIKVGDVIKTIDGISYSGEELDIASEALRGKEEGTSVNVVVIRESVEMEFNIIRSNIRIKAVSFEMKDNSVGYIKVTTFNEGTANEFKSAYQDLKEKNLRALVLDLRNNGGGLVSESLQIADTMVKKGNTMLITANKSNKEKVEKSRNEPIVDVPVVVLVNDNTASASEILAGCLKDNCQYKIIGTTTYGKGVIQTIYSFADGSGLKVTTEEYFTPNHNKINKVGIKPDIEISPDPKYKNVSNIPEESDVQLQKAIEEVLK